MFRELRASRNILVSSRDKPREPLCMFRELRAYVKEGVRLAQSFCLPLRTCGQLVSLATAQLLCDDEEQAQVRRRRA
jgi:hypothetical protein